MKKILSVILTLLMVMAMGVGFSGCETEKLTLATPDGAPTMAVAHLLKTKGDTYSSSVISGTDVAATLTKGNIDFVVAPTNAGVKLAQNNNKYKVIATTSWGNLYLVGTTDIKTLSECDSATEFLSQLNGQSVESIGTNQVPDVSFKHLLNLVGVNCTLNSSTDASVINAKLKGGEVSYGILGEPAVTGALNTVGGLKRLASVSELWLELVGTDFPQASVFAKSTLKNYEIEKFLLDLEESIDYLNESAENALELGNYMQNRGDSSLKGVLVKASYLKMNQRFVRAKDCKVEIVNFVNVLGVNCSLDSGVFYEG